ncbi:hypothetical protein MACK_003674 [Theileria orientalis]|uniref:Uncharacterized protein n=1 Tax=Theileria orientalis TaxID=68886 RepID=A0A976SJL0_THEOR|nr:hypothetical protein MACK_003674 [Theileria orientalis]
MDNRGLIDIKDKNYNNFFIYSTQFNEYMIKKLDRLCKKDNYIIDKIDKKLKILKEYQYSLLDNYDGTSEKVQNVINQLHLNIKNYTNLRLYYQMTMHLSHWTLWKIYSGFQE